MPRTRSEIPRGSFALKATDNAKGERPIYLKYFVQGKYVKRSTDIWVLPADWDTKGQTVKSRNKSAARINAKLATIKKAVDDQLLAFKDGVITCEIVQKMLDGEYLPEDEKAKGILFLDYCRKVNEDGYDHNDYGYSVYYNNNLYLNHFEEYLRLKELSSLTLSRVSLDTVSGFATYKLNEKHYKSKDAVNKCLTPLVKAIKSAKDNGLISAAQAQPIIEGAYLDTKERVYDPDVDTDKKVHYLNDEQLKAFIDYVPKSNSANRTRDIKDIFLFSMYACGLRISDIVTLEWSQVDFDKKEINKIQVKTKQKGKISPRLSQQAIDILTEWQARNLNDRFVFNYLPADFVFDKSKERSRELKMKINTADRTINVSLNHIGKKLNFPFPLTIHVARHTFCVKALSSGMSLHLVSQLMGHSSILATEKTYSEYLDETIDREVEKFYNLFK